MEYRASHFFRLPTQFGGQQQLTSLQCLQVLMATDCLQSVAVATFTLSFLEIVTSRHLRKHGAQKVRWHWLQQKYQPRCMCPHWHTAA